ncbi:lipopolysaccharide biosynthesis protein [Conexibacter sp. JD483]|uniref:lipopolysaccharide biosynthesis protein n=1 Tax=unclassified Conexibacter TaxID=2627773 RepID=UPI00272571BD|nr:MULTISPECIES: lipopolysaccharide biosynthesis protein [unclassified Conexibacter]MDO8186348.1 lipopolysaccharide biosynthesis protein [Conexibacter sp. CPCC 205706]MDO8197553.1 lipopolysaccharide biosynthesis protein [Conexibacter sp. CPCC 205762]MDR9369625.1 lipopolysaccharide biosynthesis protein [Conexibacter sp. JD483]
MHSLLKRLLTTTVAYQVGDIVSKVFAVALLPIYTRHVSEAGYGVAELMMTAIVLVSILVRLGIGEALVRYHYVDEDQQRRDALARRAVGFLLVATTVVAIPLALAAAPLSELVLGFRDVGVFRVAVLGLWAFTNLELGYALLRVDERARAYALTTLSNVLLTIALTVFLVVGRDKGAYGLLLGNYAATTVVLLGLWFTMRHRLRPRRGGADHPQLHSLRELLRFGFPTVPADASVYALNLVDRYYLFHKYGAATAGVYSLAVKLAGVVAFVVRAFQYSWPPLAYSIKDDDEAARFYAFVATYYLLLTGWAVAGLLLLGRWLTRLLAAPEFYEAHVAIPWLALGWALYGLFVIFVVIAGRAEVTTRNFPAAGVGLVVNVVLLLVLTPPFGIAGAGLALAGAYVAMLIVMRLLTRHLFRVDFEWGRIVQIALAVGGGAALGELLLPTSGIAGLLARGFVFFLLPLLLIPLRFYRIEERELLRTMVRPVIRLLPSRRS